MTSIDLDESLIVDLDLDDSVAAVAVVVDDTSVYTFSVVVADGQFRVDDISIDTVSISVYVIFNDENVASVADVVVAEVVARVFVADVVVAVGMHAPVNH